MRKVVLLLLFVLLADSTAEKILFTNNSEEIDITGDVTIDRNNGNITVTSTEELLFLVNPSGFVSLFSEESYDYDVNDVVTINYAKAFVENCEISDNPANANSWVTVDSTNGINEYVVSLSSLPKTYTIRCDETYGLGSTIQQSITFNQEQTVQPGTAPTLTLTANPTSITGSGTSSLSWTVGNDATSCTASNGWSGSKAFANGTYNQNVNLNSTTTYALQCSNQFGSTSRQVTVTVNEDPVDPTCAGIQMPPLTTQQPLTTTYADANDGQPFGASTNTNNRTTYSINQLLIMSNFSTSQQNFYRRLQFLPTPSSSDAAFANTISISTCPGDFNQETAVCVGIADPGSSSQFLISTDPGAPSNYCIIQPNTTYYLNFIHDMTPFDSNPGRCLFTTDTSCEIFFHEVSDDG